MLDSKLIYWLSFLLILVSICFSYYPTRAMPIMGHGTMPYYIGVASCVICVGSFFKTKNAKYLLCYILVVFLNYFSGNKAVPTIGAALTESISILLPACIYYYISIINKPWFNKTLLYSFLTILGLITISSYVIDSQMPGIIRAAVNMEDDDTVVTLFMSGLSPYALPHALPILIPPCVMIIKTPGHRIFQRYVGIIVLVIIGELILLSQSFGATSMGIVVLLISIFIENESTQSNFRLLIALSIFFVPIISIEELQLYLIELFRGFFENGSKMDIKLSDLAAGIINESTSEITGNRGGLLEKTFDAIIQNPIFGVNDKSYGNHNALIDRFACYGLVGFIPLVIFMFHQIKYTYENVSENIKTYYVIGATAAIVMMVTKNMMGWYQWVCLLLILPLMLNEWNPQKDKAK